MPKNNGKTEKDKSREQEVPKDKGDNTKSPSPTVRLAVTTAMTSSAEGSGKDRYPFHVDSKTPLKGVEPKPSVHLAVSNDGMPSNERRYEKALSNDPKDPTVRLASTGSMTTGGESGPEKRYPFSQDAPPQVRLAHVPGAQGDNVLLGRNGVERMSDTSLPALLVSYYYLEKFIEHQHRYCYRNWVMDSGAFSAFSSGVTIDLQEYIKCCKRLMQTDPTLVEIFALDVIGDWKGTKKNTEEMWRQGVPAIPCFHYGEPWDVLKGYCKDYPKVALGGCVGKRDKLKFVGQCFARAWPHKFHGFGFGDEAAILGYPFASTDATNWELTPCLDGSTLIDLGDECIPIGNLVGEVFSVVTYDGVKVPGCIAVKKGIKPTIIIETSEMDLQCTPDHLIRTSLGWTKASDLLLAPEIYVKGTETSDTGLVLTDSPRVKAIHKGRDKEVYDIMMPYIHHFLANGIAVHNCGFGRWRAFGGAKISVRGSSQNLRCEVLYYLDLEEKARKKWKKEMELLEEKFPIPRLYQGPPITQEEDNTSDKKGEKTSDPSVKLAVSDGKARGGKPVVRKVLEEIGSNSPNLNPTVRLAESGMGSYDSERQKGKLRALQPEKE